MIVINLVTLKAAAKQELLFNKPASVKGLEILGEIVKMRSAKLCFKQKCFRFD
jgi:hypothetical protein